MDSNGLQIRVLGAKDWKGMQRLRMAQATHAGAPISAFTSNPLHGISTSYQFSPNCAVGSYKNDVLTSFICCSVVDNFWVLDFMVSNQDPQHLRSCLEMCLERFENIGITEFYYAFPNKWARMYRTFWKEGSPRLRKYVIEDRYLVESYKIPNDRWIWDVILHQCPVPVDLLVRRSYVPKPPCA